MTKVIVKSWSYGEVDTLEVPEDEEAFDVAYAAYVEFMEGNDFEYEVINEEEEEE